MPTQAHAITCVAQTSSSVHPASAEWADGAAAALDYELLAEDVRETCPGCEQDWSGPGWCGSCATPAGWHP